jgi:AraC-like DNA-binding protein
LEHVSVITLQYVLLMLEKHYKIDINFLLKAVGIDRKIFTKEHSYIKSSKLRFLFQKASQLCDDPFLALHLGEASSPQSLGLLGYMLSNTATVSEMLEKLCYYSHLVGKNLEFILTETKKGYKLAIHLYNNPLVALNRYQSEIHLAAVISLIRQLSAVNIEPEYAYFQHNEIEEPEEYHRLFGKKLIFNAYENALVFSKEKLCVELQTPNEGMVKYFEQQAKKIIEDLYDNSWHTRTEKQILIHIGNNGISIEFIAKKLSVSVRTLQNNLKKEGYSYTKLLESVRKKLALHYLHNFSLDIATIALYLGYTEISVFSRAFKKWFNMSPNHYRAQIPYNLGHAAVETD